MNFKGLDVFVFVSEWQRTNSDDRGGKKRENGVRNLWSRKVRHLLAFSTEVFVS